MGKSQRSVSGFYRIAAEDRDEVFFILLQQQTFFSHYHLFFHKLNIRKKSHVTKFM